MKIGYIYILLFVWFYFFVCVENLAVLLLFTVIARGQKTGLRLLFFINFFIGPFLRCFMFIIINKKEIPGSLLKRLYYHTVPLVFCILCLQLLLTKVDIAIVRLVNDSLFRYLLYFSAASKITNSATAT